MELADDTTAGHVPVLRVSGDVDLETSDTLRSRLATLIDKGSPLVVVDISGVAFFDSSGLKVLDDSQTLARASGSTVALVCPNERLLRLFAITGLTDRFMIESTAERAATATATRHE